MTNGESSNVGARTLAAYAPLIANASALLSQPHVLDSNILLRVDARGRELVRAWVQMAWDSPEGFCSSHPQDQSAWSVLVHNRSLPLINVCAHLDEGFRGFGVEGGSCHKTSKSTPFLLRALATRRFTVLHAMRTVHGAGTSYVRTCQPFGRRRR